MLPMDLKSHYWGGFRKVNWRVLESWVAEVLGGKRTKASGAVHHDGDVKTSHLFIECKYTSADSLILRDKEWLKARADASAHGKTLLFVKANQKEGYFITVHSRSDKPWRKSVDLRKATRKKLPRIADDNIIVRPLTELQDFAEEIWGKSEDD